MKLNQLSNLIKNKTQSIQKCIQTSNNEIDEYKLEGVIGQGQFAQVRICRTSGGTRMAIKIYTKQKLDEKLRNAISREIGILKQLDHPNIVRLHKSFSDDKCIYLVQNYTSSLSLNDFIKDRQLSSDQIKIIFTQLISAIQYLHSKQIAHRDIKLENILYSQQIILIDFGFAIQTDKLCSVQCGTPNYMAPELFIRQPHNPFATDIWSCGVLLHFLLTGEFPIKRISNNIPNFWNKILISCLDKNPERRLTADKLYQILTQNNQINS